jgi:hypothetical protein
LHYREGNGFFEPPTAAHPMMVVPRRVRARESNCMTWNAAPVVWGILIRTCSIPRLAKC